MSEQTNMTIVTHFILLGFPLHPYAVVPVFCIILLWYVVSITGNFVILFTVLLNRRLHTPMYLFLCNLAIIDICFITTTVPNLLNGMLSKEKSISVIGCLTQSYVFFLSGTAEFSILAVMSFDRYIAICYPLQYTAIFNRRVCINLVLGIWLGSFFSNCIPSYLVLHLTFCYSEIDHFMCDVGPLLMNACIHSEYIEKCILISSYVVFFSFIVSLISYIHIVTAAVKMVAFGGKQKIMSTCFSHALVVSLVYGSCIFMYSFPKQIERSSINKEVSIMNTIVVPFINPFVYTLRNQYFKETIQDGLLKYRKTQKW